MAERVSTHWFRSARKAWAFAVLPLLALAAALLSFGPSIDERQRPTAQDIALARDLVQQVRAAQAAGSPVRLDLDNRELQALSTLASDASGERKVGADVHNGVFTARASLPVAGGLWLNASASVAGAHEGFPAFRLKIGRIPLPGAASRWAADLVRWWLARKGVELPELDSTVRSFSVARSTVSAELALPRSTGLVGHVVSAAGTPVDQRLVGRIYCELAHTAGDDAGPRLTSLVRRAFAHRGEADPAEYNRAAFVALAVRVVGERAEPLAPAIGRAGSRCAPPTAPVLLRERADLAQHWALSAALTAVLGEQTAANLGEWKELHDSLPAGSGFSFVDLAADRSGLHVARRALEPQTAAATARALRSVSEQDLLPEELMQAPEGLTDLEFAGRFGGIEARRYREAVGWIDGQLARRAGR